MLSKLSVKKPYTVVVAVIIVLILGAISFINLQTDLLPSIDLPYLVIMTSYPGASPEEVEMVVTRPIEQVVATTSNIKNINSVSSENSSLVIMEFNNDVNMDSAIIEINGNLDLIKGAWNDSIGSPMIIRLNPDMLPVMVSSVDVEGMEVDEISNLVKNKIIPELESVNGVASVSASGLLEENIQVVIDQEKIDELNKKILNKVDSKLADAESQLMNGKREIENGKSKLDSEEKNQIDKIIAGENAIKEGREQIVQGENGINSALIELSKNKEELLSKKKLIEDNEKELTALKKTLLAIGDKLSPENKAKLEKIQKGLDDVLQNKDEINKGIKIIDKNIIELEDQKRELQKGKSELEDKEREIAQGKALLNRELNKARIELLNGEKVLNEKLEEFEGAKNEAFKKASLDGVLTKDMISNILVAQNFSMPAGYVNESGVDHLVKVGNKIEDINEMKSLLLFDTGEEGVGKIYLSDVADVSMKDNSEDIYAKVNGNNAVILTFQKQSNYSTSEVSNSIGKKMEDISKDNNGLNFTKLMDQGLYIDMVVDSVLSNIIFGGILAILILIIFLRDIKPTFIIAVSIPISIVFAIGMMYFSGVTINIISLAGLALGVGMLVDNSIVVIENVYRLRSEGMSAVKAAVEGAKEVSGAIIASTITTACVFLPIVFTKGLSRQIFTDMGLTIAYSLFASLIVALTLVPTMASTILRKANTKESKKLGKIVQFYEVILRWTLKHKGIVMLSVVSLLVLSGYFAYTMGTSFIPEMEAMEMSITIEMPKENSFQDNIKMSDKVIDRISNIEGIETIGAFHSDGMMSGFGSGNSKGNTMSMYLLLEENKKVSNKEIQQQIMQTTDDLDCTVLVNSSNMDMSQMGGSGIEVLVKGREIDKLRDISLDILKLLENTDGTTDVSIGIDENINEARIIVDKEKAMENGLTVAQVFGEVNSILDKGKSITTLTVSNKDYPIIVIDGNNQYITMKDLETIKIKSNINDKEVKISDIASIIEEKGLSSINRKSQERYISVTAAIDSEHNIGLVSRDFEKKLKDYKLPEGYSIELSGENEFIKESLIDLVMMLGLAIVLIYLIMVAQFQSLLSPFIVMFTIPLAFTGGLLALWITGNNISLVAMLGFLVLSGVVVNNGIVFVDYANQLRNTGIKKVEALVMTGKTRMRPILMTAITTILGLSTLSAGMGSGAEMLQPLAIVAIGGLVYATVLTLLVVPSMYDLLVREKTDKPSIGDDI
ncbi:efflux RND transporter permease subunit [Wansuia hejianensis]|uniref:Efflux RND transporter permease subunit n=1 Tax=Wansuia hejianensis TaxID=2763667 RepID=A0A926ILQ1_9FIRM|nr:efflux RND transporter permease subunit [Wansuia hejianensis]MBC8589605.1 efflux RND transporter permease subunit [Wansuia hejianensis]